VLGTLALMRTSFHPIRKKYEHMISRWHPERRGNEVGTTGTPASAAHILTD
jgi:hypothetical protein